MELIASLSPGSTVGELNCDGAAQLPHNPKSVVNVLQHDRRTGGSGSTHHRPADLLFEAFDDDPVRSYSLMSTSSSRGPMSRSQSHRDEAYRRQQDFASSPSIPIERPSSSAQFPGATPALNAHEELLDGESDDNDNDDDGFAWDGSVYDTKARSSSIDNSKAGTRYDCSPLSASGCASIVSANSRNGASPSPRNLSIPALPCCSMPSTPDSKLSAGLEEAINTFQSWEVVHNVSFSGRSSQHQRRASAMSVSLHSTASRASGSRTERSEATINEFLPLPTNLQFFQPPCLIPPDSSCATQDSSQNPVTTKLDLLEEQEKELVELAIERSKQDPVPNDQFEPSLRKALAESVKSQCTPKPSHLSFSFALSEPPPPAPASNGMDSLSDPSLSTVSALVQVPRTRPAQSHRLVRSTFLSESLPPVPSPFSAESEMSITRSSIPGTLSVSSLHNANVMGPEDFSTSEVEEQRMLQMALERSLHEPSSPRRPHSRTDSSPRYADNYFTGGPK